MQGHPQGECSAAGGLGLGLNAGNWWAHPTKVLYLHLLSCHRVAPPHPTPPAPMQGWHHPEPSGTGLWVASAQGCHAIAHTEQPGSFPDQMRLFEAVGPARIIAGAISTADMPRTAGLVLGDGSASTKRGQPAQPRACPRIAASTGCISAVPGITATSKSKPLLIYPGRNASHISARSSARWQIRGL